MRFLAYKFLNTGIGRLVRRRIDAHMRAHPFWRKHGSVDVKYACATDVDVNHRAIRDGLGYDSQWMLERPTNTLIDLGCNTGLLPLWLKAQTGISPTGIAIDANPEMCMRAAEHFVRNNIKMDVHNGLVGEQGSEGVLHTHAITVSSSTMGDTRPFGEVGKDVRIPCLNVSEVWGIRPVDLIKIDIEGSELGFFMNELDFCTYAKRIVVEWHDPQCTLDFLREKLWPTHRLVKFYTKYTMGYAYFEHL